jgi:hypothetical protein
MMRRKQLSRAHRLSAAFPSSTSEKLVEEKLLPVCWGRIRQQSCRQNEEDRPFQTKCVLPPWHSQTSEESKAQ